MSCWSGIRPVCTAVVATAALLSPAAALADHSTTIQPFGAAGSSVTVAGCQAKGLWGIPAPKSSGSGLAAAMYLYTVSAVIAGDETAACLPIAVTTTVGSDSAVLQWNAVPGASGYRVYRNDGTASPATLRALFISVGNTILPPNATTGGPPCPAVGRADKCLFQDNGGPQDAARAPTLVSPTSQAGAHADANIVQTIDYGTDAFDPSPSSTTASLRSDTFHMPPGFVANPNAAPTCELEGPAPSLIGDPAKFGSDDPDEDTCPNSTLLGTVQSMAVTGAGESLTEGDIYNGETKAGEPARLFIVLRPLCSAGNLAGQPGSATCNTQLGGAGREVEKSFLAGVATIADRGGGVYGVDVDTVQAEDDGPISASLNVLVPSPTTLQRLGKIHLSLRRLTQHLFGTADQGTATTADDKPFTTLPTSCAVKSISVDAGTYTDTTVAGGATPIAASNCGAVPFDPSTTAELDTFDVLAPVGFGNGTAAGGDVGGIHQSGIKTLTATFPRGLTLNTNAGNATGSTPALVGTVSGTSDELGNLIGTLTLESVNNDAGGHFDGSFALRADVTDTKPGSETNLVLDGTATADKATGQLTAVFDNLPEVPFRTLSLNFAGGSNSPLVNPPDCGDHTVTQVLTPYSGASPSTVTTTFGTFDRGGTCPDPRPFAPTLAVSGSPTTAGAFTTVTTTISRPDKHQALAGFALELPPGMLAKLGDVAACPEASALSGTCPESSRVGAVSIAAGTGSTPVTLPGKIYLAGPVAGGDIASLVVAIAAKVGPFDLGTVVSRAGLSVHFSEGQITVTATGALPTMLSGIPVRIQSLTLKIDRADFQRNPTSCAAKQAKATFTSQGDPTTVITAAEGGASATSTAGYQATGCAALPFAPKVTGSVGGDGKTKTGALPDLDVTITQAPGEASMKSAKVTLPASLGAGRIAPACDEAALATDSCPAEALVGTAEAVSPLLPGKLAGRVVLVSRGATALPRLAVLLHGAINLRLDAGIELAGGGRIVNLFSDIPDVPLTSFTLHITNGLLKNATNLCAGKNVIDAEFTGYNGKTSTTSAPPAVKGCPQVKVTLKKVKSGKPSMTATIARTSTSSLDRLRAVRITLPKGIALSRNAAKEKLTVKAGGKRVPRNRIHVTDKLAELKKLTTKGAVTKIVFTFETGALRASGSVRKQGRNARPRFRFRVTTAGSGSFNVTVKAKPKS